MVVIIIDGGSVDIDRSLRIWMLEGKLLVAWEIASFNYRLALIRVHGR